MRCKHLVCTENNIDRIADIVRLAFRTTDRTGWELQSVWESLHAGNIPKACYILDQLQPDQ